MRDIGWIITGVPERMWKSVYRSLSVRFVELSREKAGADGSIPSSTPRFQSLTRPAVSFIP
jgi:hypothetical protein